MRDGDEEHIDNSLQMDPDWFLETKAGRKHFFNGGWFTFTPKESITAPLNPTSSSCSRQETELETAAGNLRAAPHGRCEWVTLWVFMTSWQEAGLDVESSRSYFLAFTLQPRFNGVAPLWTPDPRDRVSPHTACKRQPLHSKTRWPDWYFT